MDNLCPICLIITTNIQNTQQFITRYHQLVQNAEDHLLNYIINTANEDYNNLIIQELRLHLELMIDTLQLFLDEENFYIDLHQTHIQRFHEQH